MEVDINSQAEMLALKVKHHLVATMGRLPEEANADELYRALSYALREEIMINWLATTRTWQKHDPRMVYYFSMEFLPGKVLSNNVTNICSYEIVKQTMQKLNCHFSDLTSRELDPGLGNGGLGRLASCLLDSFATHHIPVMGYGLRYQYGIFEQQLWEGAQVEAPDPWLMTENPWEFRKDLRKVFVKFCGFPTPTKNLNGEEVFALHGFEQVWAVPYDIPIIGYDPHSHFSVVSLRLWTTKESPRNFQLQRYNAGRLDQAAENATLTDVLYPSDHHETGKRIRLKQEFLLVSASLQDIIRRYLLRHDNFAAFPDKIRIQINDTHPALVIPELMRLLIQNYDLSWKMAWEITQACTSYTNHTILSESLEEWDEGLLQYLLPRQYRIIERLNHDFCHKIRKKHPHDEEKVRRMSIIENGSIRMPQLAIVGSHKVNGVATLHTEILKHTLFKDFYEMFPEKFLCITNGVTQRRWLLHCNPDLAALITELIGDRWITDFSHIQQLAAHAENPEIQERILVIRKKNKSRLTQYLQHENPLKNSQGKALDPPLLFDIDSLFDVQIKRIHEYKRQLMNALHIIMRYHDILETPQENHTKRTVIIGGKAAANYLIAKDIIRLIYCISRKINHDSRANNLLKVVFVQNYGVSKAEVIIPAADLSEQISTAGTEASGTGNMKLSMNGALTIGTHDGANIEMKEAVTEQWWPFSFGCSVQEIAKMKEQNSYNPWDIYTKVPKVKKAVDALRDQTFAQNEEEHKTFSRLYSYLLEGDSGSPPDRYFTLKDLESFYQTQQQVDKLFETPNKWAAHIIHNIAGMGKFSIDRAAREYVQKIWESTPCPIDEATLSQVREEYKEHDKCRIY